MQPARRGETVLMEAKCLRAGRSIAFTEATFWREADGEVVVRARQQMAILHYRPSMNILKARTAEEKRERDDEEMAEEKEMEEDKRTEGKKAMMEMTNGTVRDSPMARMEQTFAGMEHTKNFNRLARNVCGV